VCVSLFVCVSVQMLLVCFVSGGLFRKKKKKVLQRKNHYHKMDKDESLQDDLSKKLMKKILEAI